MLRSGPTSTCELSARASKVARIPARLTAQTSAQRLHDGRAAAVDVDCGAGDVGTGVGGEETGEVRELLGASDPAQRNLLGAGRDIVLELDAGLLRGLHVLIGLDEADQ